MSENTTHNSPNPLKYGTPRTPREASPSELTTAAQKQEEVLARHRKMNENLLGYKKKMEEGIATQQEKLIEERKKTKEMLTEMMTRHEDAVKAYQEQADNELKMLSQKPLFDQEKVNALGASVASMRAQNAQLRKAFALSFSSFMEEFNANKSIAIRVCRKSMENFMENSEDIKARVEVLQQKINEKCSSLQKTVKSIHATPRARLQIGSSLEVERPVNEALAPHIAQAQIVERKQILCVSSFLSRCLAMYDDIISH